MAWSGGVCESRGGAPSSSSSSSSSPSFLFIKSSGPLCSWAPPYCVTCQREARLAQLSRGMGMHTYWYRPIVSLMSPDENSYSFLLCPKMMTATSTEHSTESSCAFLKSPPLRFRNVLLGVSGGSRVQHAARAVRGWFAYTERLRSSLMGLISILRRPMVATVRAQASRGIRRCRDTSQHGDGMWLVDRGSRGTREVGTSATATTIQTRCAFRGAGGTRRARWGARSIHDSAALYMSARCATEVRHSKHTILRL
jgi:hypothetical protein